ncbi:MAG: nuclear transport factor 2 family protein [Pseudomonadota bacterium]
MLDAQAEAAIRTAAREYCAAIHHSRPEVFEVMCHESFLMAAVSGSGQPILWDKAAYLSRVAGRAPFPGEPSFEILTVDLSGTETAHVKLWVDVPPRRFEDYLGFFCIDGEWKLITKLFRTIDGPALDG